MSDRSTMHTPAFPPPAIHVPHQAAPIDRAVSSAALDGHRGVDANLFGLPVGDWLEEPGKWAWGHAKDWLNK